MSGEELFELMMKRAGLQTGRTQLKQPAMDKPTPKLGEPINTECPLKPE